jgi:hypothetical protein
MALGSFVIMSNSSQSLYNTQIIIIICAIAKMSRTKLFEYGGWLVNSFWSSRCHITIACMAVFCLALGLGRVPVSYYSNLRERRRPSSATAHTTVVSSRVDHRGSSTRSHGLTLSLPILLPSPAGSFLCDLLIICSTPCMIDFSSKCFFVCFSLKIFQFILFAVYISIVV